MTNLTILDIATAKGAKEVQEDEMSRDGYLPPGCTQDECDKSQPGYYDEDDLDYGSGLPPPPEEEPDDQEPPEPAPPTFYTVALVLHDRAFGGPEEGGWYYETYEVETSFRAPDLIPIICLTEDEAKAAREKMDGIIKAHGLNEGRREISSVLSEGRYEARIFDGFPKDEPQQRPHYE